MGMDIWGMYNGCVMESKEFVYPIVDVDYENATTMRPCDRVSNVKIIRDGTLRSNGFDFDNAVYVRENVDHKLEIGDYEWVKWNNGTYVRVEVIDIILENYNVPVFSNVNESLWESIHLYHDKKLIDHIHLFNQLYYSDRDSVLNFSDNYEVNEMSLHWWDKGYADFIYNNTLMELDQGEVDYLIASIDEFRTRDILRDGAYSRFFEELRSDVIKNRKSYLIEVS